jgi:hypothetical protein
MVRACIAAVVTLAAGVSVAGDTNAVIADWAKTNSFKLEGPDPCTDEVEKAFGAKSSQCWFAKSKKKRGEYFPRVSITSADYGTEAKAKARMKSFEKAPPGRKIDDEGMKSYPLRAGFRLGDDVIVVTSDAFAFEGDVDKTAKQLAQALGGTELTCWGGCK